MMSHAEPAAWQIAPRIDMTIAATCRHAPLPGSFGPQQQSIEPAIVANRPPTAESAPGAPNPKPMSVTIPKPRTVPPMHFAELTSFGALGAEPHILRGCVREERE